LRDLFIIRSKGMGIGMNVSEDGLNIMKAIHILETTIHEMGGCIVSPLQIGHESVGPDGAIIRLYFEPGALSKYLANQIGRP
jgi:hypothetical protein